MLPPQSSERPGQHFYCPLAEDSLWVLATLFVLYQLASQDVAARQATRDDAFIESDSLNDLFTVDPDLGLAVRVGASGSERTAEHVCFLVRSGAVPVPKTLQERTGGKIPLSRLATFLEIPSAQHAGCQQGRLVHVSAAGGGERIKTLVVSRFERMTVREFLGAAADGKPAALWTVMSEQPRGRRTRAVVVPKPAESPGPWRQL